MKKIMSLCFICILIVTMAACGETKGTEGQDTETGGIQADTAKADGMDLESDMREDGAAINVPEDGGNTAGNKILIAYFSWAGNAVLEGNVDAVSSPSVLAPGNVEQLAGWVQERTAGDLFSIRVEEPYPGEWDACLSRANREKADGTRPKLKETVENMEDYDVLFLGYPNWWYSCPMAVVSFLESYDFSGKQIYLFCSHGTGGLAASVQDIEDVLQGGQISENVFDAFEEDTASSQEEIGNWLAGLGY